MKITIINSKGYWKNGWVSSPESLQLLIESLERNNLEVETFEVNSLYSLEQILKNVGKNNLILPNAYYVNRYEEGAEKVWLADIIEAHNLPFIGSNSKTLYNVLHKEVCQSILQKEGIPVPKFVFVSQSEVENVQNILDASDFTYPAVIKLTAESGSMGMDEKSLVQNQEDAIIQIQTMIQKYQQDIIVEEFLPSNDITITYLQGKNGECKLITTWYLVSDKPGSTSIMGHKERFMPWGGVKKMTEVKDKAILAQVEQIVPKICEILKVRDITRIDGRLDTNGKLKVFDVNGFPALSFPESVSPQQVISCYPAYKASDIFDILINTIVASAAHRYNMLVPNAISYHTFFTLSNQSKVYTTVS